MGLFDSEIIDLDCPGCGHKHSKTIGWIKTHSEIPCQCGATINLDKDQFVRDIDKVEKELDSIPREIKIDL